MDVVEDAEGAVNDRTSKLLESIGLRDTGQYRESGIDRHLTGSVHLPESTVDLSTKGDLA